MLLMTGHCWQAYRSVSIHYNCYLFGRHHPTFLQILISILAGIGVLIRYAADVFFFFFFKWFLSVFCLRGSEGLILWSRFLTIMWKYDIVFFARFQKLSYSFLCYCWYSFGNCLFTVAYLHCVYQNI